MGAPKSPFADIPEKSPFDDFVRRIFQPKQGVPSKTSYCAKTRGRFGPPHSMFGQTPDGTCFCAGCSWADDDYTNFNRWWSGHSLHCKQCRDHGPYPRD